MPNRKRHKQAKPPKPAPQRTKRRAGEESPGSMVGAAGATGAPEGRGDVPEFRPGKTAADRNNEPVGLRPHQGHVEPSAAISDETASPAELNISAEKVCLIVFKAREFDVKVDPAESDPGSDPTDDDESEVLEDYADDATQLELREAISDLNEDEAVDLVALAWIGRGDFDRADFEEARALARERHRQNSADYLVGIPTLGDFLEEGLATLGHSCDEYEFSR